MLQELLNKAADQAEKDGVKVDGEFGGEVHKWVRQNCSYRPSSEFFIVTLLTAELADREARREGFKDQFDRAWSKVSRKSKKAHASRMKPLKAV